jgi:hypothetical protein
MVPFLQWTVGAIVWTLANAVYVDMRRKGVRGFGRFAAFWVSFPVSFLWMALVKERRPLSIGTSGDYADDDKEDDSSELLLEVRRDREARRLSGRSDDGGTLDH